jgi:glycosyltransferase involved in cell wall biosynthesis
VVIPVYNHARGLASVLPRLRPAGLPCLLVDDGSRDPDREALAALQRGEADWVELLRLPENRGKGEAVLAGLRRAAARGFTHAVQLDADGQHDPREIPAFLDAARRAPGALVAGCAVFDRTVPAARLYGRRVTLLWVRINTLSREIQDAMCGFRVYPVGATLRVADRWRLGGRMEFDAEVMVRLSWEGVPVVSLPTPVTYPADGVSHFRLWRDNLRISGMHTRLFFGMLRRLPGWLRQRSGS